jgi:putative ATPase
MAASIDALDTERESVPLHLRNAVTFMMRNIGYGTGYKYAHDYDSGRAEEMECLPDSLRGRVYYNPKKRSE